MPDIKRDLPEWAGWMAQDADGSWWVYEAEPHQHHCGWYENEVGRSLRLGGSASGSGWRNSLQKVGQG